MVRVGFITGSDCRGRDRRHKVWVGASGPTLTPERASGGLATNPRLARNPTVTLAGWLRLFLVPVDSQGAGWVTWCSQSDGSIIRAIPTWLEGPAAYVAA